MGERYLNKETNGSVTRENASPLPSVILKPGEMVAIVEDLIKNVSDEVGERCPKARRRREGGLVLAGVAVASSCQAVLPAFGCLFLVVGTIITVASYRGPEPGEDPAEYLDRVSLTSNLRVLGPCCLAFGSFMLALGAVLFLVARRAKRNKTAFHCPIHGDFYPIAHQQQHPGDKKGLFSSCWDNSPLTREEEEDSDNAPQCPHSNRCSISTTATPLPSITPSHSSNCLGGSQLMVGEGIGTSTRSLSVSYDVASFPHTRSPSPQTTDTEPDDDTDPEPEAPATPKGGPARSANS